MQKIYGTIRKLGAISTYRGFPFLADAIYAKMYQQGRPLKVTKDIYPYLAKKYETTAMNVEHSIRIVINACWTKNKDGFEEIAGYPLNHKPTNSEFIDMVSYYLSELND